MIAHCHSYPDDIVPLPITESHSPPWNDPDYRDSFFKRVAIIPGHCAKTLAILTRFLHHPEGIAFPWLVVADDDTLLSIPRLFQLLACYNPKEAVIIGERYGFGFGKDGESGYDYPTGGAG